MKTTRTLRPLPIIESSSVVKSISRVREQSSETRKPVEKRSSRIALSRSIFTSVESLFSPADLSFLFFSFSVKVSGASRSLFNSASVIKSNDLYGVLASSILSDGMDFISCLARYFKKALMAIK